VARRPQDDSQGWRHLTTQQRRESKTARSSRAVFFESPTVIYI